MLNGYNIISGGTDNHLMLVDLTNKDISGKKAENALHAAGITVNKNMIPFDTKSPFVTSGIRIGTPAVTTRGMKEEDMKVIASFINKAITNHENDEVLAGIKKDVKNLCANYPLYPELTLS
jgi:glycine hydroxymethyltransferase